MRNATCTKVLIFTASQRGLTLVELLVSVAVGGILMSITVPAMTGMLNTHKAISATNALFAGLNLARSEAIKRNARAVLCKSANGISCAASGGWEQGWILFHDLNNNAVLDEGEEVVRQQGPASAGIRLRGNLPVSNYVSYTPTGTAKLISGAFQAGTFTLCMESSASADVRQIVLSGTGRARAKKGVSSDCS